MSKKEQLETELREIMEDIKVAEQSLSGLKNGERILRILIEQEILKEKRGIV